MKRRNRVVTKKSEPKSPRENRVRFPTQRVKPATLATAQRLRAKHGGLGRVLDHWAEGAAAPVTPPDHDEQLIGKQRALDAARRRVSELEKQRDESGK